MWGGYRPPAPRFRQPCFAHIVRSKKLINAPGDFHGDRQKKVHVVWNDPIKRDFFNKRHPTATALKIWASSGTILSTDISFYHICW